MPESGDGVSPVIAVILIISLTVVMAAIAGAAFIEISGGAGSANIVALNGEAGDASSPVYINLLGGEGLNHLVKLYVYDGEGKNIAVTSDDEIFTAGKRVSTKATGNIVKGGLQKVSISGEFDDGKKQYLWEGNLGLADGGEIVNLKYDSGSYNYGNMYRWVIKPVIDWANTRTTIYIMYDSGTNILKLTQYWDNTIKNFGKQISVNIEDTTLINQIKKDYLKVSLDILFAQFGKIKINTSNDVNYVGGIDSFTESNQVFKIT